MKKMFTLILSVLMVSSLWAQKPEGIIMPVPEGQDAPIVDGIIDEVWAEANVYNIDKTFVGSGDQGVPTLGESGETTWKALWTKDGFYLLLTVTDESYWPSWIAGDASYLRDKPEVYFDWNYILEDGLGCQSGAAGNLGHYQFAPEMTEENYKGGTDTVAAEGGYMFSFMVEEPNYVAEYYFPFAWFKTNEGGPADLTGEVGFDAYICESDEGDAANPRRRAVWANVGADGNEAWANMDNCGIITFDGAEPPIYVDEITLSVDGSITENGQTLQVMSVVLPEDAAVKTLKWIMTRTDGSAASATISPSGLITPVMDEELSIQGVSSDGFIYSNIVTVSVSGQKVTLDKINIIKNGFFDDVNPDTGAPSDVWYGAGAGTFTVVDGVLEFTQTEAATNIWDNGIKQWIKIPYARKDENFIFSFKAWADADRTFQIKIEDQANGWATMGICSAPETDGTSFWPASQMSITTVPTVYTFSLTFANLAETNNIQFNYQLGDDPTKVYLDSVMIYAEADMGLVPVIQNDMAAFSVYPNPASTKLNVELASANLSVAIYNSVGVKMDEVVVFGTRHTFDVSRYTKGMYFVKAGGAVVKFIK